MRKMTGPLFKGRPIIIITTTAVILDSKGISKVEVANQAASKIIVGNF